MSASVPERSLPSPPLARPLLAWQPALREKLAWCSLAELPTAIERLRWLERPGGPALYAKRDDRSSAIYGGNKVRTLELLFGDALGRGATHVISTGAYGSNHAVATALHARRAGLIPGAVIFPQPMSEAALENLRVLVASSEVVYPLRHWSVLPFGMLKARRAGREAGRRTYVMVPGGATPLGALGYVSAALELADQIAAGELPLPRRIFVGVGSTCTSAGLLVGLAYAARYCPAFAEQVQALGAPELTSVRVTPWPVTSRYRIVSLARRTSALVAELAGDRTLLLDGTGLSRGLRIESRFLGRGYGKPTPEGRRVLQQFEQAAGWSLDTTYSAKAAAAFVEAAAREGSGGLLFWSTKSTTPLPEVAQTVLDRAAPRLRRWMRRAQAHRGAT